MTGRAGEEPRRPLRLVQVGMGGWGRDWMAVTASAPGVEPVAWVDPVPAARAATVARGAPAERVFPDLAGALEAVPVEACLVTTPVEHHVPVALAALRAGLPVLVEKPFAATLGEAVAAIRAAGAAGRTLMVSQNYRYHPAPRAAAAIVAEGRIGAVESVEVDFRRNGLRPLDWRVRHQAMRHPLLLDMSIHHFDLLRLVLAREPAWIRVWPINPGSSGYTDAPAAVATLGFDGGILVSYRASWISSGRRTPWGGRWRIDGSAGGIEWVSRGDGSFRDALRLRTTAGAARPVALPDVGPRDRLGALAAFVEAVRRRVEPETSGRRNLATLALTFAAIRSADEDRPVELAELRDQWPEDLR